ncbi:MAG: hypothetical protein ABI873_03515 [Marmoricola sp.]
MEREEGAFLALLVELIGARRCIEVGTFTGYSSTAVALALPDDGRLVCCDVSEGWTTLPVADGVPSLGDADWRPESEVRCASAGVRRLSSPGLLGGHEDHEDDQQAEPEQDGPAVQGLRHLGRGGARPARRRRPAPPVPGTSPASGS